jgi:hypothetical protein
MVEFLLRPLSIKNVADVNSIDSCVSKRNIKHVIHHIRTILFSLPVNYLKDLRDFGLDKGGVDAFSPKYRLSSIICDVASFRLFKPVRFEPLHDNNRKLFLE